MKHLKRVRGFLTGILSLVMIAGLFAGCSGNSGSGAGSGAVNSQKSNTGVVNSSQGPSGNTGAVSANSENKENPAAKAESGTTSQQATGKDTDGDGIPDTVEKTYGTNPYTADTDGDGQNDKLDKDPVFAENPIKETSTTKLPVNIKDSRVEDNADADHLEITLTNTGKDELKNFDIYFTVTDNVDNKKEAYYQKLDNLVLKAGESKTIHFDNKKAEGHYFGNMNGLYGKSKNELIFDVQLHSNNYQPLSFQVKKSKGTAEVSD